MYTYLFMFQPTQHNLYSYNVVHNIDHLHTLNIYNVRSFFYVRSNWLLTRYLTSHNALVIISPGQLNILPLLNWLYFCFKTLLSSHSVMCSSWRPLSAIESPAKSRLPITNYHLPWKLHLYHKIDSDPSEISRTSVSKLCMQPWPRHAACIIDDDMLVRHTPTFF